MNNPSEYYKRMKRKTNSQCCCPLRAYRNLFGAPGTGVHSFRLLDAAGVDFVLTLLVAMVTAWGTGVPLVLTTIGWFVAALVAHVLFGVNTSAVRWLGLAC